MKIPAKKNLSELLSILLFLLLVFTQVLGLENLDISSIMSVCEYYIFFIALLIAFIILPLLLYGPLAAVGKGIELNFKKLTFFGFAKVYIILFIYYYLAGTWLSSFLRPSLPNSEETMLYLISIIFLLIYRVARINYILQGAILGFLVGTALLNSAVVFSGPETFTHISSNKDIELIRILVILLDILLVSYLIPKYKKFLDYVKD